ncbi:GlxA family transcriptional regulator [Marinibaculum pumilum]|uniref:GlxA family transcriptional regulator n=1 Tax=Marinibaculum pumilum TaxID=1766165 RepID=A0ABV7KYV8_9PROT
MAKTRTILLLAFEEVALLDLVGPADAFTVVSGHVLSQSPPAYRVAVASVPGGPIRSVSGLSIDTLALDAIDPAAIDTIIVPGGGPPQAPPVPPNLVAWLAGNGAAARRLCSVCTGAFLLAAAGLAEGRRLATHWEAAGELQRRHPAVSVEPEPIFVHDGPVWSSAGFTAGIDLALALVEEDHGHAAAMQLARLMVMFVKRPGEQRQFSSALASQTAADPAFDRLHAWIVDNLDADLRVEALAARAGMAPRTFARRYARAAGRTPARTVELLRLEAACQALLDPQLPIKQVARRCGFGDEQNLRRCFLRRYGMVPAQYRSRFARPASVPACP